MYPKTIYVWKVYRVGSNQFMLWHGTDADAAKWMMLPNITAVIKYNGGMA